jgi:hypothetical protein
MACRILLLFTFVLASVAAGASPGTKSKPNANYLGVESLKEEVNGNANWSGTLIAQVDDDSYDPFSDYSEFDEDSDEEADTYFFKHGRLLTIGFMGGYKGYTGNLSSIYQANGTYGIYLAYFFDLRFALQLSFSTGDAPFTFATAAGKTTSGNVGFTVVGVDLKYFFNTQNVTKGLADLNPYFIGGLCDVFRTYTVASSTTGSLSNATGSAWGLDLGAGVEIPVMRRKAYFGIQGIFHYVTFPDANTAQWLNDYGAPATLTPSGYQYDLLALLGVNF